jgi:hypothetical protein
MKVFAIITLAQSLSRSGSDRWGQFLRAHGEKEHLWLGRKLTPEEFNVEFPKALRFAGPDRPLVGRILVEPEASDGEGDSIDPVYVPPTLLVSEHEAKIAEIQAGVDAWVAEQNQKLLDAANRIAELEQLLSQRPVPAAEVTEGATPPKVEETIPEALPDPVPAASTGSDSVSAGAQAPDQPDSPPVVIEAPQAPAVPAKKAKGAAKAK